MISMFRTTLLVSQMYLSSSMLLRPQMIFFPAKIPFVSENQDIMSMNVNNDVFFERSEKKFILPAHC